MKLTMKKEFLVFWLIVATLLVSCSKNIEQIEPEEKTTQEIIIARADQVITALQARDMKKVSMLSHPAKGVRFSPYAFVQDKDLLFTPDQLTNLLKDPKKYHWGEQDGSGNPLEMTFEKYCGDFVYDQDYAHAEKKSFNERIGKGNTIDNSQDYYSGGMVVEYHFSGFNLEYAGMDWRSLRLVFQKENSQWYLVGIIHDEWTI